MKKSKIATPLRAIHLKCYDCSGWNWVESANCASKDCILWPLRFGKKPKGIKYSYVTAKAYKARVQKGV